MIDLIINEYQIYLYNFIQKDDWSKYIESNKIDSESILFVDENYLLLYGDTLEENDNIEETEYESFLRLGDICIVAKLNLYDSSTPIYKLLGLSDIALGYHENSMTLFVLSILNLMMKGQYNIAIMQLRNIYESYLRYELLVEYYREYNQQSMYKLNSNNYIYYLGDVKDPLSLDISFNAKIFTDLYYKIWNLYRNTNHK